MNVDTGDLAEAAGALQSLTETIGLASADIAHAMVRNQLLIDNVLPVGNAVGEHLLALQTLTTNVFELAQALSALGDVYRHLEGRDHVPRAV